MTPGTIRAVNKKYEYTPTRRIYQRKPPVTFETLFRSPVPTYSAPNVGPCLEMTVLSIVELLPMVHFAMADESPVPDVLAPKVTPSLMIFPRSMVLLDPAMSCVIAPLLLRF